VPIGITLPTIRFLDIFLLHCLLSGSPADTPAEIAALGRNQHKTAAYGREPGLTLERDGQEIALVDWGAQLLRDFAPIAAMLDAAHATSDYSDALRAAQSVIDQPDMLPSARVLDVMARDPAAVAPAALEIGRLVEIAVKRAGEAEIVGQRVGNPRPVVGEIGGEEVSDQAFIVVGHQSSPQTNIL